MVVLTHHHPSKKIIMVIDTSTVKEVAINTIATTGVLSTVAQNNEVQNIAVALVSSVIIQSIIKVFKYFSSRKIKDKINNKSI